MNVHYHAFQNELSFSSTFSSRFFGFIPLQIAAQPGSQKLKHCVLSFLIVWQYSLYHIFCVHNSRREDVEPQQILIDSVQAWKYLFERVNHTNKCLEIGHIPAFVILREKCTVPETVVEYCFIRVGRPKPKIRQPQSLYRSHRVGEHSQRVELQMFKNLCRLFVHISKAFRQQLILAIKVTVNCPW